MSFLVIYLHIPEETLTAHFSESKAKSLLVLTLLIMKENWKI